MNAPTSGDALRNVRELRREIEAFEREQVAKALAEGATFSMIARYLGVSRQAAHRRFRSLAGDGEPLRTSADVRRVLRLAREEAAALSGTAPGGAHVVVATLRAADLPAAAILRAEGMTLERVRAEVNAASPRVPLFRRDPGPVDLRSLLAAPAREARRRGDREIEIEHLLLGVLEDDASGASRTLLALGVDLEIVRAGLDGLLKRQPA